MRRAVLAVAAIAGASLLAGGAADGATRYKLKQIKIGDNYFSPAKLTVKVGQPVQWVWPADVGDTHDVTVRKAPAGAKRFQSPPFAASAKWPRPPMKFKKAGTYKLYCTFHETEMTLTITVKT